MAVGRPLDAIVDRDRFLQLNTPPARNYLHDVKRFCHKVYAQLDALQEHDKLYWLDADIEITKQVPEGLISDILDQSFVSFLGRDTYTETGVIAFNKTDPGFQGFERLYKDCYYGNQIFRQPFWTDCHAFDCSRLGGGHNLTPNGKGVDNVLKQSPLGEYMIHHKGRLKLVLEESDEISATA